MADASSDLEIAPGSTTRAARRKANQIPGPMMSAAKLGITNKPEPTMDAREMTTTPPSPTLRSSLSATSSMTPLTSPLASFDAVCFKFMNNPRITDTEWSVTPRNPPNPIALWSISPQSVPENGNSFCGRSPCDDLHFYRYRGRKGSNGQCGSGGSYFPECVCPDFVVSCKIPIHVDKE